MSRNPAIEAIHAAYYDWETAADDDKQAAFRKVLHLSEEAIKRAGMKTSARELLEALGSDYSEYRRMKKRESWARLKK
jgi:hypothetical protein